MGKGPWRWIITMEFGIFFWGWMEESFITLPKSVALHSTGVTINSIEFKITNTLLL